MGKFGSKKDGKTPCKNGLIAGWARTRKKIWRDMHQHKVAQMMKSAEGSVGLLHQITRPTPWRELAQISKEEEDVRLLDRCEATRKEWAKHWECDESVDKPEEIGGKPAKAGGGRRDCNSVKTGVGYDGFHPIVPLI